MKTKYYLFEKICQIMADASGPRHTLMTIVKLVADHLHIDVCSVYMITPPDGDLVLRASAGLRLESIDTITMTAHEGLTGLVLEKGAPLFVKKPADHPRYKYFESSGEERFSTYLGIPLRQHRRNLGALVFQTVDPDALSEKDIPFFSTIAGQIAALASYGGLVKNTPPDGKDDAASTPSRPRDFVPPPHKAERNLLRGIPASPGIGEGQAHYLVRSIGFDQIRPEYTDSPGNEISRLETVAQQLRDEIRNMTENIDDLSFQDAAIFESHLMMLSDPSFRKDIVEGIRKGYTAAYALKQTVARHIQRFMKIDDPYLRERAKDIEDIGRQVLARLLGDTPDQSTTLTADTILIASDISPLELIAVRQKRLKGLALAGGGRTSHAAILAKSFEIPLVIGLSDILDRVQEGDHLILDGNSGLVFRSPSEDIINEYKQIRGEKKRLSRRLHTLKDKPPVTKDGHRLSLNANIGLLSDTPLVQLYGAQDIGLYRTEFPFLIRSTFPTEDEQVDIYEKILAGVDGRTVTIRTLDLGGDKFLSYFDAGKEQNPYLGWRSIRVSLERDDIFRPQIRAILRVSGNHRVRLMFPMICSLGESKKILRILEEEKQALADRKIAFDPHLPIGAMVEVPGAVKILPALLTCFDFVSIGTNDLIQYMLAVDRNNPKVASLYNPLHPAVLLTVQEAISACKQAGKPISVCGEAAGTPKCAYLFMAMGCDALSMTPSNVPAIKRLIRNSRWDKARADLAAVLEMSDEDEIGLYLNAALNGL